MNQRGKKKNELKEMRTTSGTMLNTPTFKSEEPQKKKTKRQTMKKYLRR